MAGAERAAPRASYLALHPAGFTVPRRSLAGRWSLTPPFHPYRAIADPAVFSLWHFPSARLETCSPHLLPCGITWRRVLWCSDFPLRVTPKRFSVPLKPSETIPQQSFRSTPIQLLQSWLIAERGQCRCISQEIATLLSFRHARHLPVPQILVTIHTAERHFGVSQRYCIQIPFLRRFL